MLTNQLNSTSLPAIDRPRARAWIWITLLLFLCALRLPSLVQPAGGDQGLYVYAAQRILAGDVMYRDLWDQKPPAIAFLYAAVSLVASREAIVPGADLAAAIAVAWLLVVLGRRRFSPSVGFGAAAIFLLLGDPYLLRLSGIYVRGQCEPFIALAVTASLALLARRERNSAALVAAGVLLAIAFWLKYNALAYGLPAAVATLLWRRQDRSPLAELALVGAGFAAVAAAMLDYFALNGALLDLRLATIDYNLRYSNETYTGPLSMLWYAVTFPFDRARMDMLWFAGGLGALLLAIRASRGVGGSGGRGVGGSGGRGARGQRIGAAGPQLAGRRRHFHRRQREPRPAELLRSGKSGPCLGGRRRPGDARDHRHRPPCHRRRRSVGGALARRDR